MKLTIIGIDALSIDFIKENISHLPGFRRVLRMGCWGRLRSTIPPTSLPAWTSLSTGVNPGKHDVYEFRKFVKGMPTSELTKSFHIKTPRLWDILAEKNIDSLVVNYPGTFPPKIKRGLMISGMLTTDRKRLSSDSKIRVPPEYKVEEDWHYFSHDERQKLHEKIKEMISNRFNFFWNISNNKKANLNICVYIGLDRAGHLYWKDKTKILEIYKKFDKIISKHYNNDENIFIVSDHGFGSCKANFYINSYLDKLFNIKIKQSRFSKLIKSSEKILSKTELKHLARHLPNHLLKAIMKIRLSQIQSNEVFSGGMGYICSKGSIDLSRVRKLRYKGIKVFSFLEETAKVYHGRYTINAPRYVFILNGFNQKNDYCNVIFEENKFEGTHTLYGTFLAIGTDFQEGGVDLGVLSIYDIAPTILHMFDVPIPIDMDGRVLKEVFYCKRKRKNQKNNQKKKVRQK